MQGGGPPSDDCSWFSRASVMARCFSAGSKSPLTQKSSSSQENPTLISLVCRRTPVWSQGKMDAQRGSFLVRQYRPHGGVFSTMNRWKPCRLTASFWWNSDFTITMSPFLKACLPGVAWRTQRETGREAVHRQAPEVVAKRAHDGLRHQRVVRPVVDEHDQHVVHAEHLGDVFGAVQSGVHILVPVPLQLEDHVVILVEEGWRDRLGPAAVVQQLLGLLRRRRVFPFQMEPPKGALLIWCPMHARTELGLLLSLREATENGLRLNFRFPGHLDKKFVLSRPPTYSCERTVLLMAPCPFMALILGGTPITPNNFFLHQEKLCFHG